MSTVNVSAGKEELDKVRKHHEQQWPHKNTVKACTRCQKPFTWWKKRCRHCGDVVCTDCSKNNLSLPERGFPKPVRVCSACYDKIVGSSAKRRDHLMNQSQGMPRIVYATTSRQGAREDNEDRIAVDIQHTNTGNRDDPSNPQFVAFFGVFDGHSGSGTAQYLKEQLPLNIVKHLKQGQLTPHELSRLRSVSHSSRRSSLLRDVASERESRASLPPTVLEAAVGSRPRSRSLLTNNLFEEPSADSSQAGGNAADPPLMPSEFEEHKIHSPAPSELQEDSKTKEHEGLDLLQIVQYSCLKTDAAFQSDQLKKPNSLRCHSGSCAVFVVFTNAKLKPASKVRRIKEVFYRISRSSISSSQSQSGSRMGLDDSPRSYSKSLLSHLSPKRQHGTPSRSETREPTSLSLGSPGGVPWPFRGHTGDTSTESKSPIQLSVVCASVGDSEISVHKKGRLPSSAKSIFRKHNWEDPDEVRRAAAVGAVIKKVQNTKRICLPGTGAAVLAISRAFGDVAFKRGARVGSKKISSFFRTSEGSRLKEDQIRADPEVKDVSTHVIKNELNLMILASDGLWDVYTPQEAVQFVEDELEEYRERRKTLQAAKKTLPRSFSVQDYAHNPVESLVSPSASEFPSTPFVMSPTHMTATSSGSMLLEGRGGSVDESSPMPNGILSPSVFPAGALLSPPGSFSSDSLVSSPGNLSPIPPLPIPSPVLPSTSASVPAPPPPPPPATSTGPTAPKSTCVIHRPPKHQRGRSGHENFSFASEHGAGASNELSISGVSRSNSENPSVTNTTRSRSNSGNFTSFGGGVISKEQNGATESGSIDNSNLSTANPSTDSSTTTSSNILTPAIDSSNNNPPPPPPPPPPPSISTSENANGAALATLKDITATDAVITDDNISHKDIPTPTLAKSSPSIPIIAVSSPSNVMPLPPISSSDVETPSLGPWLPPPVLDNSTASRGSSPSHSPYQGPSARGSPLINTSVRYSPDLSRSPSGPSSSSLADSSAAAHEPPLLILESIPTMMKKLSDIDVPTLALPPSLEHPSVPLEVPASFDNEDDVLKPLPRDDSKEEIKHAPNSAPSKSTRRRSTEAGSVDDLGMQYNHGGSTDAESEREDWVVLQKICDKLADSAVERMAERGYEGDNVSIIIIHFPDDKSRK